MLRTVALATVLILPLVACAGSPPTAADAQTVEVEPPRSAQADPEGLIRKTMPDEDPGPPFYARVTTLLSQFFHDAGWLAIPFYRPPECVPPEFEMLQLYDFPGPEGPGAFRCPLLMEGFLLIEPDAPLGTFPRQAVLWGDAVPFWFVPWADFQAAAVDGAVSFAELRAMGPVAGVADRYHETLKPREGRHLIVIDAAGTLEDGRTFRFHVTHREHRTEAIQIDIR